MMGNTVTGIMANINCLGLGISYIKLCGLRFDGSRQGAKLISLLYSLSAFGQTDRQMSEAHVETERASCDVYPDEAVRLRLMTAYYNNRGPFAGIFTLNSVAVDRLEPQSKQQLHVHVRYQYVPVPDNPWGRTDIGYDERIFYFECDEYWFIKGLSPHMTAEL